MGFKGGGNAYIVYGQFLYLGCWLQNLKIKGAKYKFPQNFELLAACAP